MAHGLRNFKRILFFFSFLSHCSAQQFPCFLTSCCFSHLLQKLSEIIFRGFRSTWFNLLLFITHHLLVNYRQLCYCFVENLHYFYGYCINYGTWCLVAAAYCVVAVESAGRQIPIAFLERVKEDFNKRYGGGKAATAVANSLNKEFGYYIGSLHWGVLLFWLLFFYIFVCTLQV